MGQFRNSPAGSPSQQAIDDHEVVQEKCMFLFYLTIWITVIVFQNILVQFSELEVECVAYKQDYENSLSEIELLKAEQENAIAQLNQFQHSISTKLTDQRGL